MIEARGGLAPVVEDTEDIEAGAEAEATGEEGVGVGAETGGGRAGRELQDPEAKVETLSRAEALEADQEVEAEMRRFAPRVSPSKEKVTKITITFAQNFYETKPIYLLLKVHQLIPIIVNFLFPNI